MTNKEKIEIYENFFHKINLYCTIMNHDKVGDAVRLIDSWSYAHRVGNGEYTEDEQQAIIEKIIMKMKEFK